MRELEALEERVPGAAHARLADPAGRRHLLDRVHPGRAHRADARAWTTRSATRSWPPGPSGSSGTPASRSPYLCELKIDGLAINLIYEKGRLVAGRHPRRRADRRGRHPQRADHRARSRDRLAGRGRRPSCWRSAARSSSRSAGSRELNALAGRAGKAPFANPRNAAAGRCGRRTRGSPRPGRCAWWCTASAPGEGFDARAPVAGVRAAGSAGGCRSATRWQGGRRPGRRAGVHRLLRASTGTTSSTRSTASWSRSTRSRCSAGSARPAGRRAGRSPSSTRRRRSTPSCSTSGSTWAAPGGSRRTP